MIHGIENLWEKEKQDIGHIELIKIQSEAQTERRHRRVTPYSSPRRSIKFRLPLLIGTLLLGSIIATTWAAYREVKASAFEVGQERLRYVTQQLASLLQQSASNNIGKTYAAANDSIIRNYLLSPQPGPRPEVAAVLRQFLPPQDQNGIRVELWNANHSPVLAPALAPVLAPALTVPEGAPQMRTDLEVEFKQADSSPSFGIGGAIRSVEDKVIYPLVAIVKNDLGQSIGYLVRWRQIAATAEARQQFMNLIGRQADLYVGNNQGDVWTDMVGLASKPPVDVRSASGVTSYQRQGNNSVKALGRPINGTSWFILVEFSDREILVQADQFLRRMMVMGVILLGIGLAGALILSRRITQPLHSFTQAASAIADGDYSRLVKVRTRDELDSLARAFNIMVIQMRDSRNKLEQKVQERTAELQAANRELESFSYSVSHDLRAPLRAVAGFSRILSEEYEPHLPAEAQAYLHRVEDNAQQMGQLIDDLLAFSRLGRQAIKRQPVAPADLARTILEELLDQQQESRVKVTLGDLPGCQADPVLLKQVFVNLLSNALKFTRQREVATIEIGCLYDNGVPVYFVKDNGVGFDMQYAHKLFGVFQRLHRAEEYEGTGVGLAIVQRVINRHGGRVWADAKPGQGASFYFTVGEGDK
jgi:signal transduction histidine kinase